MKITEAIAAAAAQANLSEGDACDVMEGIMNGQATDAQIAGLITAMRVKGETEEEITGFARAIRSGAARVDLSSSGLIDTCGTGGDQSYTFNISTAAAFVVAACGVPVAKHGNRSVSSKCGSADVLEELGVNLDLNPGAAAGAMEEAGIAFLFAPVYHAAMKHAVKARKEIGIRTIFNLLGPLVNPARAEYQLMGVYSPELTVALGTVLSRLGVTRALVVHGAGRLDEISTLGVTRVTEVRPGLVKTYEVTPGMFGLPVPRPEELQGGGTEKNAAIIQSVLKGERGAARDIVVLNSAAALYTAGKVESIAEGLKPACKAIDSGEALHRLELLKRYTNANGRREAGAVSLSPSA